MFHHLIAAALLWAAACSACACDNRDAALNTLLKLNAVSAIYQLKASAGAADDAIWAQRRHALIDAMAPYTDLLVNDNYIDACIGFAVVADDFDIDLDKVRAMTVADYADYDRRYPKPHRCSSWSLLNRISTLSEQIAGQPAGSERQQRMAFAEAEYSHLYAVDVGAVCAFMDELESSLTAPAASP